MGSSEVSSETETSFSELYRPDKDVRMIKKDGTREGFNVQKVIDAVGKSAYRALTKFTDEEKHFICRKVVERVNELDVTEVPIPLMHNIVESVLEEVKPIVAKSYRDYRNYKQDFVRMMDDVYKKSQSIMYIGDKENANTDSALVSTKRSLIFNQFNKELYQKFFMTTEEIQACRDGYIYVHDMSARRDTMNCCLFNVEEVLTGGFEMGNIWYNEPKTLDVAFDVIGDIVLSAASQQYGGFTVPSVDHILERYAEKSYEKYIKKYTGLGLSEEKAKETALEDVERDFEQGFQGWEYKFNTVASSRGDYPFITVTAGTETGRFAKMATIKMLEVRRKGQGKEGCKKPVLFPKIVFLYDEKLHGPGGELEDVFEAGVECSAKTMYPDWLSLTGKGYIASMYKRYGKIISPMGCRAFLSPWYERGGMHPADDKDEPVFVG
ncbi:MAG TPA: anaerobic ribonucleoside-triphosphate reductase, partial [Lachnospiraceae bacterium]|nr:anaerobic ribonucleoside-triphosphate reductase [Lachnospiraceae bacterium]